jgi:hypothetical protein
VAGLVLDEAGGRGNAAEFRSVGSASVVCDAAGALEHFVVWAGNDVETIPVADFAARSGIEGLDLDGLTAAGWSATMDVFQASQSVDSALEIMGERDGALIPWDALSWRY